MLRGRSAPSGLDRAPGNSLALALRVADAQHREAFVTLATQFD